VEGVRIYTREAAKLVQALLQGAAEAGAAPAEAASAGGADFLTLQSNDREFLTAERATELLAPLLAPGAKISKVRAARKERGPDWRQGGLRRQIWTALRLRWRRPPLTCSLRPRALARRLPHSCLPATTTHR
jgi:hypothetical protein